MTSEEYVGNEAEREHRKRICQLLTFDRQLARFRDNASTTLWDDAMEARVQSLKGWSSSRYELIELLPWFQMADENFSLMREVARDYWGNREPREFVILSDPGMSVTAWASDPLTHRVDSPDKGPSIVWFPIGMKNWFDHIARACAKALATLRQPGSDSDSGIAGTLGASTVSAVALHRSLRPCGNFPSGEDGMLEFKSKSPSGLMDVADRSWEHKTYNLILGSLMTFIIGHEAGHVALDSPHRDGEATILPAGWVEAQQLAAREIREMEADYVGLLALWDGMSQSVRLPASIDITFVAPFLYVGTMAGVSHYLLADSAATSFWLRRGNALIEHVIRELQANQFERNRVESIAYSIPKIMAASMCWAGAGTDDSEDDVTPMHDATAAIVAAALRG